MGSYARRGGALVFLAACILLFVSCGGGGGGHHGGGGGGGGGGGVLLNGQLLDAYTQGVTYSSSGPGTTTVTGTTDVGGSFLYYAGQTTTFSLSAGTGGSIALGSVQPVQNGGGFTIVFVGGMNDALEVAQVLQSLNYSGSAAQINVSNLTLTAADVVNLQDYITSGGTSTGSAANYGAMMTQAQTDAANATPGLVFVYPGGATAAQASANLATAAGSLTPPGSLKIQGLIFWQAVGSNVTVNPAVVADASGMDQFVPGSGGTASGTYTDIIQAFTGGTASTPNSGTYSVAGNVMTDTFTNQSNQPVVTTLTIDYKNPSEALFTFTQTVNGTPTETATGNAYVVSAIAIANLANRTLTFTGFTGGACAVAGASPVVVFTSNGQSYNRYCSNDLTTLTGIGTVAAASGFSGAEPAPLQLTDTPAGAAGANTLLMALVSGSIGPGTSGAISLLTTLKQPASGSTNGIFSFTAQ